MTKYQRKVNNDKNNACSDESNIDLNDYIVTCEVNERSVLLLNNVIPHRSLNNFELHH